MRIAKSLSLIVLSATLSACATFSNDDVARASSDDLAFVQAKAVELETELARAKTENARLANQVLDLQRENEKLKTAQAAPAKAPTPKPVAQETSEDAGAPPVLALRDETDLPDAVVDNPETPDMQGADVPVETSPRLTQPTFASTDAVFENDADAARRSASSLFGVHLASYRKPAEAREGWRKLQRENPDELGLLEPRLDAIELPERGLFLRLIGGGLSSQDKALELCANLKAKGLFCSVSEFEGERLSLSETG
ncbi:MAG: SPOR domain-containing protein [Pseudomonadota bacterium]